METLEVPRAMIDELTSIERAIQAYNDNEFSFLEIKLEPFRTEDETLKIEDETLRTEEVKKKQQLLQDFKELFFKAASKTFSKGDIEKLERYSQAQGHFELLSYLSKDNYVFPTTIERDAQGKIVRVNTDALDNEIMKRLCQHIYDVLLGRTDVRVCQAPDCQKLFTPTPHGRNQKYCSRRCFERIRSRKRKQATSGD